MTRSVVLFSVKEGTRPEQLDAIVRAMKQIRSKAAYRSYDSDVEHNRIRRELLAPIVERLERFQYAL